MALVLAAPAIEFSWRGHVSCSTIFTWCLRAAGDAGGSA
jgi:hypothetical protein